MGPEGEYRCIERRAELTEAIGPVATKLRAAPPARLDTTRHQDRPRHPRHRTPRRCHRTGRGVRGNEWNPAFAGMTGRGGDSAARSPDRMGCSWERVDSGLRRNDRAGWTQRREHRTGWGIRGNEWNPAFAGTTGQGGDTAAKSPDRMGCSWERVDSGLRRNDWTGWGVRGNEWIPAFAGMTGRGGDSAAWVRRLPPGDRLGTELRGETTRPNGAFVGTSGIRPSPERLDGAVTSRRDHQTGWGVRENEWIPAFAGMTGPDGMYVGTSGFRPSPE